MGRTIIPSPLVFLILLSVTLSHCTGSYPKNSSEGSNPAPVEFEKLVEFDRDVHFLTPDGQDVVAPPGSYTVEIFGDDLRFTSIVREGMDSITVQGKSRTHEVRITKSEPVILKGDNDQQLVILLMPGGKAIEAVGSHSGVFSRHPHIHIQPGFLGDVSGKLPVVQSILVTPPPPAYDPPPPGNISPYGTLYIKGEKFKTIKGKVMLEVQVPVEKHYYLPVGVVSLKGSKPGTRRLQLEVLEWSPNKIIAKMPLVSESFGGPSNS